MTDNVFDLNTFSALREWVGDEPEVLGELIALYLEDAPQRLREMRAATEAADAAALQFAAHTLKSTSANMGALALSELSDELESLGREGRLAAAGDRVAQAEAEFDRVKSILEAERLRILASALMPDQGDESSNGDLK
jgi:HPt (histidine-containing phosphotransfer) domain-containing protein